MFIFCNISDSLYNERLAAGVDRRHVRTYVYVLKGSMEGGVYGEGKKQIKFFFCLCVGDEKNRDVYVMSLFLVSDESIINL